MSTTFEIDEPTGPVLPESASTTIIVLLAANAFVLGLFIVLWPDATLLVAAVLFGIQLIVAGIFRIVGAFVGNGTPGWQRALLVVVGLLLLIVGIACLKNPGLSLATLVLLIGIGWLVDGVIQIAVGASAPSGKRALPLVLGIVSVVASIILLSAPVGALLTLLHLGGWLLMIIGVVTIVVLIVTKIRDRGHQSPAAPATA